MTYLSLSPLPFASLLSLAICNTLSDNHFAFLHFFFFRIVLKSPSRSFCFPSDLGSVMGEAIWWLISQELSSWFGCKSVTQVFSSGWKWKLLSRVWLCDSMDYTVHGILQARILEWVAFLFSRGSSQPRDQTQVSHIADGFFTSWATREAQEYWNG